MDVCKRQWASIFPIFLLCKVPFLYRPLNWQNKVLTGCSGPPYFTAPTKCSGSFLYRQRPSIDNLYRLIHCIQRNYLAAGYGVVCFVHAADCVSSDTTYSWERTGTRAIYDGSLRSPYQPPRDRIPHIRRHLDAIPTNTTGNRYKHELCRATPWCGYLRRAARLGNQWAQEIPGPGSSKSVKRENLAYFKCWTAKRSL